MQKETQYNVTINKLENSEVEIQASIPWEHVEKHRPFVVEKYGKTLKIDGFRPGHIPENVVIEHVGENAILSEMAERALQKVYPEIIIQNDIQVLSSPSISITKLTKDNPFEFTAKTTTLPEITLPDYKALAKEIYSKEDDISVTDEEVADAVKHIQQQWVRSEKMQKQADEENKKVGEIDPRSIEVTDEELPSLDETFIAKVGPFKTVEEFKTKLKENIGEEKKLRNIDKKRAEILDSISKGTTVSLPSILVESELNRMMGQFKQDVERTGMELEKYLKETGKTEDDLKKSWTPEAEKYAKNQLIMNELSTKEELHPDPEAVDKEVAALLEHYKDADTHSARVYVETIMRNRMVFEFLEKQK